MSVLSHSKTIRVLVVNRTKENACIVAVRFWVGKANDGLLCPTVDAGAMPRLHYFVTCSAIGLREFLDPTVVKIDENILLRVLSINHTKGGYTFYLTITSVLCKSSVEISITIRF